MTWVVPLALGSLAIVVMAVFTMFAGRQRQQAQVTPAAVVGPRILVHDINDDRCTGCDACVAVCPTNVLDLVDNKSRVLRFEDCIQCEACMVACPTEALVMFPEGATPPPLKVPEIDENFQTAVPGQYLIGEVAGKPLVKNAANLGRVAIEHMLVTGLRPGMLGGPRGPGDNVVDVAIVGSGPGGLSAALSCIARGLSYVVLEKEQMIASTISRYPKGKLVMAEPYDTVNLSLLPVFDSSKEQLIPIWREVLERTGVRVNQGESVETVTRQQDGSFEVRTTIAGYRAQRVVLSIGTRGKPRTLQVPGENLPKVFSLLEDPDEWRGRSVLVIGGGDSACEAALALADAGAKVIISYRGKGFNRAAPKNKSAIEAYAAEGRIKAKLGSQVLAFDAESVTLALGDGSQKRYPNDAAFTLIGADPPIAWLERLGVRFVERPHQYQMGKTDDLVRRFLANAIECPEDAARATAQVLGGPIGPAPMMPVGQPAARPSSGGMAMPMGDVPVSGPRKWLRSATSIFSNKSSVSVVGPMPRPPSVPPPTPPGSPPAMPGMPPRSGDKGRGGARKFDAPVPLSEFAKRQHTHHTGHGRRDALSAGERTRILRMLRDEGGRLADEDDDFDSQVYMGPAPAKYDIDFDDSPAPAPAPAPIAPRQPRGDVPAKPAVVVGIAQAQANASSRKKKEAARPAAPVAPIRAAAPAKRQVPQPFGDEPTRQVDDALLASLRSSGGGAPARPRPSFDDEATRMAPVAPFDNEATRMGGVDARLLDDEARFAHGDLATPPRPVRHLPFEDNRGEETKMANINAIPGRPVAPAPPAAPPGEHEERTRAVDIRNDKSLSDIDWDLD